jgi:[methyl-Co(III) methanol-specific corrinoid protein]:coenzyme M methyltransferase
MLAALLGGQVDRIPVGNVVSNVCNELMEVVGISFPQAHLEPEKMAALAAGGHTILGYDTVMPVFSVIQEAVALGCEADWGDPGMMPGVRTHPFATAGDMHIPNNWMEAESIEVVLEALVILRKDFGDRALVVGKVMGPWSLSYHLMGVEQFLLSTLDDPGKANQSLELLKSVTVQFANAQARAGADVICLADHATGGMVSPDMYREMLLPIHQEIIGKIGCPVILHCCGDTTDRLEYFAETGIACYHFESQVQLDAAVRAAGDKMTLMGNINNPSLLLQGTPDEVSAECRRVLASGIQILSPECAVPLDTPIVNLKALVQVAKETS